MYDINISLCERSCIALHIWKVTFVVAANGSLELRSFNSFSLLLSQKIGVLTLSWTIFDYMYFIYSWIGLSHTHKYVLIQWLFPFMQASKLFRDKSLDTDIRLIVSNLILFEDMKVRRLVWGFVCFVFVIVASTIWTRLFMWLLCLSLLLSCSFVSDWGILN